MDLLLWLGGLIGLSVLALEFSYDSRDDARMLRAIAHGIWPGSTYDDAVRLVELYHRAYRDAIGGESAEPAAMTPAESESAGVRSRAA